VSEKTEGTFVVDGLLEGKIPPEEDFLERLQDWIRLLGTVGVRLNLEAEGDTFNLLANHVTVPTARLGPQPADRIREALEDLVRVFPDPGASEIFSTLRSVEYAPGEEIQTVYLVRPDGSVEAPQRTLDARTAPPEPPATPKERVRVVLGGLALLAIVFGISSLFIDYRSFFRGLWHRVAPLDVEQIEVDPGPFVRYFSLEEKERGSGSKTVVLTLAPTAEHPRNDDQIEAAVVAAGEALERRLALEALARGYIRFEVYGEAGQLLRATFLDVRGLRDQERIEVEVPVPRDPRPARIVLNY
jgi:hypothetical protein